MMMNGTQMIAKSAAILETPTRIGPRCAPFSLERLDMWYNNNTNSGKDREANDGDTDSMLSAESIDLIVTSKLSPLQHHCQAILNSNKDANGPAVGVFDADGNWACLTSGPKDSMEDQDQGQEIQAKCPLLDK
uniref:Uncharacterized protein n=1 Tax=Melanopsichium pennsylvanicum 4 TaxID=1398559 RepID=A0A077QZA3_9BASI|nr:uncharacterized protein BN887_06034 [Melanopsichium pennsylvanicum 4]